tara:strand:- start:1381 stop:1668 length:288 start_codon:yes stop_codon:yes gene_type:complete
MVVQIAAGITVYLNMNVDRRRLVTENVPPIQVRDIVWCNEQIGRPAVMVGKMLGSAKQALNEPLVLVVYVTPWKYYGHFGTPLVTSYPNERAANQ